MKIFKIVCNPEHAPISGGYDSHIIAANEIDEVVNLAKEHPAGEGEDGWHQNGVTEVGIYTGTSKEPYIIHSNFICEP